MPRVSDESEDESVGRIGQGVLIEPETGGGFGILRAVGRESEVGESGFATTFDAEAVKGLANDEVEISVAIPIEERRLSAAKMINAEFGGGVVKRAVGLLEIDAQPLVVGGGSL